MVVIKLLVLDTVYPAKRQRYTLGVGPQYTTSTVTACDSQLRKWCVSPCLLYPHGLATADLVIDDVVSPLAGLVAAAVGAVATPKAASASIATAVILILGMGCSLFMKHYEWIS
jgi:hypothetical protein